MSNSTPSPLLQNSISTLVINGVLPSHNVLRLKRVHLDHDLVEPLIDDDWTHEVMPQKFRKGGIPARPPSALPAVGNLVLECSVSHESRIGDDSRSSVVFAMQEQSLSDPGIAVPPLVLKMARHSPYLNYELAQDAWCYEEMESIQGIAVPRCYGLFEADVPKEFVKDVLPWQLQYGDTELEEQQTLDSHCTNTVLMDKLKDNEYRIYVILLERAGEVLPIESVSQEDQDDINGLYEELASLGIYLHHQIKRENILRASASPPGLPNLPSRITGKIHNWRLIDFSCARKSEYTAQAIHEGHLSWTRRLFNGLAEGYALNQRGD